MNKASYIQLIEQLSSLLEGEHDLIANLSNTSALLKETMENINYLYKNNELILGPFQGRVACMHIPMKKGVCGTSAYERKVYRVRNVDEFPNHIACDHKSKSEIVIPLVKKDILLGVLDIDSPIYDRFQKIDEDYLCTLVNILVQSL